MSYDFDAADILEVGRYMPAPAPTYKEMTAHWRGAGADFRDTANAISSARRDVFARRGRDVRRLRGDWMSDNGFLISTDALPYIEVYQHPDGRWWLFEPRFGDSPVKAVAYGSDAPIVIGALTPDEDAAGIVCLGGNFCPDGGELERIGMAVEQR